MSSVIENILADFGKSTLKDTLGQAVAALETKYGLTRGTGLSLAPDAAVGNEYSQKVKAVVRKFEDLFSEINNMRSSYLPFELAIESLNSEGSSVSVEEISNSEALMESYENTFMRLLGMPSTADINVSDYLSYISINGELVEDDSFVYSRYERILDERQLNPASRNFTPGLAAFDMASNLETALDRLLAMGYSKGVDLLRIAEYFSGIVLDNNRVQSGTALIAEYAGSAQLTERVARQFSYTNIILAAIGDPAASNLAEADDLRLMFYITVVGLEDNDGLHSQLTELWNNEGDSDNPSGLLTDLWNELVLKQQRQTIQELANKSTFFKYSYLLYPPVQDGRISKCINEPGKIVAEPFLESSMRTVSGNPLKTSLLEAIIRIRLDKISGTSTYMPEDTGTGASSPVSLAASEKSLTYNDIKDSMGLLEALVITRLATAMVGFAFAMRDDIEELAKAQRQTGYVPRPDRPIESDNAHGGLRDVSSARTMTPEQMSLQLELMVEESLMMLFGDNSVPEALNLQKGTQRNSGVRDAHLMSSVISVLSIPRDYISSRTTEIREERERTAAKTGDRLKTEVTSRLGFSKGVGALDILAIVMALFSMPETLLLSLLSPSQFDNLKKEFPDNFFDGIERETIAKAVNEVTRRSYDGYMVFLGALQKGHVGVFTYPADNS